MTGAPANSTAARTGRRWRSSLPPLDEVIDADNVLCLNMPAGTNPALSRAVGVMLKQAWLQTLLRRPAEIARRPARDWRPVVFLCDEYQSFRHRGRGPPGRRREAFALTRQARLIPTVATQSISSLRAVLGQSEAWRALLQNPGRSRNLESDDTGVWPTMVVDAGFRAHVRGRWPFDLICGVATDLRKPSRGRCPPTLKPQALWPCARIFMWWTIHCLMWWTIHCLRAAAEALCL